MPVREAEWHRPQPEDSRRLQHELRRLEKTVREQGQVTTELAERILALSFQVAMHSDEMRREREARETGRFLRTSNRMLYGAAAAAVLATLFVATRSSR